MKAWIKTQLWALAQWLLKEAIEEVEQRARIDGRVSAGVSIALQLEAWLTRTPRAGDLETGVRTAIEMLRRGGELNHYALPATTNTFTIKSPGKRS